MTIDVRFVEAGGIAEGSPDPAFPKGRPVNLAGDRPLAQTCTFNLPHPAPRCGGYLVECRDCGFASTIAVTGLADDPSMVTMPCRYPRRLI